MKILKQVNKCMAFTLFQRIKLQLHHKFPATYYTITYYLKIIMKTSVAEFDNIR